MTHPSRLVVDAHVVGVADPGAEDAVARTEGVTEEVDQRHALAEVEFWRKIGFGRVRFTG
jgi:hypothetical protein